MKDVIVSIEKFWDIKGLSIGQGRYKGPVNVIRPVFKVVIGDLDNRSKRVELITGLLTESEEFITCPIRLFFVEFSELSVQESSAFHRFPVVSCQLKLFNIDFSLCKVISFSEMGTYSYFALDLLCRFIGYYSRYIENGYDFHRFEYTGNHFFATPEVLLSNIQSLKFRFFVRGQNRPGRDDYEYYSARIESLPKDPYVLKLILDGLRQQYPKSHFHGDHFSIDMGSAAVAGLADRREKEIEESGKDSYLRNKLIVYAFENFDKERELWSRYTRTVQDMNGI